MIAGSAELNLFEDETPIPKLEALESISLAYHGILPALLRSDLPAMRDALSQFRRTGFKKVEVQNQARSVQRCLEKIEYYTPYPCGMSSVGPLIYVIHDLADQDAVQRIQSSCQNLNASVTGNFRGRNSGYESHLVKRPDDS